MTTAPDDHFRGLPYFLSLGAIGAATAVVSLASLSYGSLLHTRPRRLHMWTWRHKFCKFRRSSRNQNNDTPWASSSVPLAHKAANPTPAAMSEQEQPALEATALETAFVPLARSARATRVRVALYHRQVAPRRHGVAPWRPDARAGPNSGGGFYGPPNVNVGYINPR
jgi:hypothetical protein